MMDPPPLEKVRKGTFLKGRRWRIGLNDARWPLWMLTLIEIRNGDINDA